jgi:hypothetical protein
MSATIYHLSDYARRRARRRKEPLDDGANDGADDRRGGSLLLGILVFVVAFVLLGVLLVEGVASVGREHSDCLQSGRRVCGLFHAASMEDAGARTIGGSTV